MRNAMNRGVVSILALVLGLGGVIGCAEQGQDAESPGEEASADASELASDGSGKITVVTAKDVWSFDADGGAAEIAIAQDCVFIQFCDEPPAGGTWKVVGKVRRACVSQCTPSRIGPLLTEFVGDAKAVCGKTSLDDGKGRFDCF
jgi:hypothetical protein